MSSENENLRALLAEARNWAVAVQDDSLRQRIDAALAEPVELTDCERESCEYRRVAEELMVAQVKVAKERDEARAEAETLREVLKAAGDRLRACSYELTEFSYQEMASVLFDLPQATEVEP